ncbi:tRNA (cytidine(34)-2'-O)-methyltransferase [Acidimicrobiaceae bacterium]|nr:tRNA (cytidine(34)-2'-O)-methyltransferase [Candidatus Actinomarina sp.]MDC0058445.1 tRNA (cytidine(34)-2'-O)-methyltransferase [Acidimicrobiaceae bacterium]NND23941.1 tRNA (cytidine(34)-2'-O)-methyltransferase [Acidimicrobiia bacterium]
MEIVLYQPEIAGNVGACIRLSANTGIPLNIIKPFGFAFQENKIRRAGLDYHDLASVSIYESWNDFKLEHANENIGYLSSKGAINYWDTSLANFDYLVFGPESVGLPDDIIKNTENLLTIPMDDSSRSINLANSVAIVGYEYLRQIDG